MSPGCLLSTFPFPYGDGRTSYSKKIKEGDERDTNGKKGQIISTVDNIMFDMRSPNSTRKLEMISTFRKAA